MNKPFFSVIIPVFNKGDYVLDCLKSVINQSFCDFEVIVVFDPCTDNSYSVVDSIKDPRVKVIHREKAGPGGYAARNLGAALASANWLCFLDADDEWKENHLECAHEALIKHDVSFYCSGWVNIFSGGKKRNNLYSQKNKSPQIVSFKNFLKWASVGMLPVCTNVAVVSKSIFLEAGGFPENICKRGGDIYTWLTLCSFTGSIFCNSEVTAVYNRGNSGVVSKVKPEIDSKNCVYMACASLKRKLNLEEELLRYLNKTSNMHVLYGIKAKLSQGCLEKIDLSYLYERDMFFYYRFLFLSACLPAFMQKSLYKIVNLYEKLWVKVFPLVK